MLLCDFFQFSFVSYRAFESGRSFSGLCPRSLSVWRQTVLDKDKRQRVFAQRLRITPSNTRCRAGSILTVSQYSQVTLRKNPAQKSDSPCGFFLNVASGSSRRFGMSLFREKSFLNRWAIETGDIAVLAFLFRQRNRKTVAALVSAGSSIGQMVPVGSIPALHSGRFHPCLAG